MKDDRDLPLFVAPGGPTVFSVAELTAAVRAAIEETFAEEVTVRGEVSNFKHHNSRHMYFSLKDEEAVLRCVFFHPANSRLRFTPADGLEVVARGTLGVYPPQGSYQLYVTDLALHGEGELMAALERLKKKLAAEGLFDETRKRPLPRFPRAVGVVTSPSGAAYRDIKNVLSRRWPGITIILRPTRVQGAGAAADVAQAIRDFDEAAVADVLIVGRGGGSLEDLWAFNEEVAVRAVAASRTPVISAVGHEVDWALTDFAADVRAPTPSAAAELAVPLKADVAREVTDLRREAGDAAGDFISARGETLDGLIKSYAFRAMPRRIAERRQRLDEVRGGVGRGARHAFAAVNARCAVLVGSLRSLSPAATLGRGYNLATRGAALVKSAAGVASGDALTLHFADGARNVRAEGGPEEGSTHG